MELVSIIEYQGDNKTVVWKHPIVNFNNNSQLIVRESQEAVFYLNGEALDTFGPGEHILETGKVPMLSKKLFGKIVEGEIYQSEVYFVNLVEHMNVKWGTNPKIRFNDKNYGNYPFELGVFGSISFRVVEAKKLIVNLVGTENSLGQEKLMSYLWPIFMQNLKNYVVKVLDEQSISIFELEKHVKELSDGILQAIKKEILHYGIEITGLWIESFLFPEDDDVYNKIKVNLGRKVTDISEQEIKHMLEIEELKHEETMEIGRAKIQAEKDLIAARTEKERSVLESESEEIRRKSEGITKKEEELVKIAMAYATNDKEYGTSILETGFGKQNVVSEIVNKIQPNTMSETMLTAKADELGTSYISIADDEENNEKKYEDKINSLIYAKKMGMISEEEYEEARKNLIDKIINF